MNKLNNVSLAIFLVLISSILIIFSLIRANQLEKKFVTGNSQYAQIEQNVNRLEAEAGRKYGNKENSGELTEARKQLDRLNVQLREQLEADQDFEKQTYWIKVIFSGIFCVAGLFVLLSKKYDDDTKKWAVGVLTLIAGVWIGTAA
jgi:hypothetical protein